MESAIQLLNCNPSTNWWVPSACTLLVPAVTFPFAFRRPCTEVVTTDSHRTDPPTHWSLTLPPMLPPLLIQPIARSSKRRKDKIEEEKDKRSMKKQWAEDERTRRPKSEECVHGVSRLRLQKKMKQRNGWRWSVYFRQFIPNRPNRPRLFLTPALPPTSAHLFHFFFKDFTAISPLN